MVARMETSVLGVDALFISVVILTALPGNLAASVRVGSGSFYVLKNTTLPCHELQALAPDVRRVAMNDDQMMELHKSVGGVYNPAYMARNREEAERLLPNLIDIPKRFRDQVKLYKAAQRVADEGITRRDIIDYIRYLVTENTAKAAKAKDENSYGTGPGSHRKPARKTRRKRDGVDGCSSSRRATDSFPLAPPADLGLPESFRYNDGKETNVSFCHCRGSYADEQEDTKILCTQCQATSSYGPDVWPPVFSEFFCHVNDTNCLEIGGVAQGVCRQMTTSITALRRMEEQCVLALEDGQTVIVDSWQPYSVSIGTACECTVYDRSFLSPYV